MHWTCSQSEFSQVWSRTFTDRIQAVEVFQLNTFLFWSNGKVSIAQERTKRLCCKVAFIEAAKLLIENYDSDSRQNLLENSVHAHRITEAYHTVPSFHLVNIAQQSKTSKVPLCLKGNSLPYINFKLRFTVCPKLKFEKYTAKFKKM